MKLKTLFILLFSCCFNILLFADELIDSTSSEDKHVSCILHVEPMPEFPGGQDSMMSFVKNNLIIPEKLKGSGIKGKVFVSFVVTKIGKVEKIQVVKGLNEPINDAVVALIKKMPNWKGGIVNGQPTDIQVSIPVFIDLTEISTK